MDLTPGEFLAANFVVVTLVVGSYLFIRKTPRQPVVLNLKNPRDQADKNARAASTDVRNFSRTEYRPRAGRPTAVTGQQGPEVMAASGAARAVAQDDSKELNILFNWNGHTWDAHEVLGIPAGSSRVSVQKAFESLKMRVDAESVPYITAAYHAILSKI